MASLTQWTWVWVNSGTWWWTGRPGVLQSMGSQRVRHDWAAELNWTLVLSIPSPWTPSLIHNPFLSQALTVARVSSNLCLRQSLAFHQFWHSGWNPLLIPTLGILKSQTVREPCTWKQSFCLPVRFFPRIMLGFMSSAYIKIIRRKKKQECIILTVKSVLGVSVSFLRIFSWYLKGQGEVTCSSSYSKELGVEWKTAWFHTVSRTSDLLCALAALCLPKLPSTACRHPGLCFVSMFLYFPSCIHWFHFCPFCFFPVSSYPSS